MSLLLLGMAFGFAILNSYVVWQKNKSIEKFSKPLTVVFLLAWTYTAAVRGGFLANDQMIWYLVGLLFCLIGDIFLFLPPEKWFVPGLASFLLGHIFYIISFGVFKITSSKLFPALLLALTIIIVGILIDQRLVCGIKKKGKNSLVIPIIIYSLVISCVLFSAWFKFLDTEWGLGEALLLAVGAMFFYISDILNAWERFVSKFNHDRLIIMVTYHLGQFGLAAGIVNHLTSITG